MSITDLIREKWLTILIKVVDILWNLALLWKHVNVIVIYFFENCCVEFIQKQANKVAHAWV